MKRSRIVALWLLLYVAAGCSPKVGSDAWCRKMHDTPKADWSANDAREFAKHCIFKSYDD
jgi:Protein of unknown function (DUF3012)